MANALTGLPFDDVRTLMRQLPQPDPAARAAAEARNGELLKPKGSLGRLEEIAVFLAGWRGVDKPAVTRPTVALFAGNHGVLDQGVSMWPMGVTRAMTDMFMQGGAAINQICAASGLGLKVFDLALDIPTADFTKEPALSEKDCAATIAFGMEALAGGADLICVGEMGIGNTTSAAAIYAALYGDPDRFVGPGAGADDAQLERKRAAVQAGLDLHAEHLSDPLEVLRRFGGRETAAIAGTILAARMERIPVIIDGYVATSAAAVLQAMEPAALDHCLFGHLSAEPAHAVVLEKLGVAPLLDLGMRLGEGTGAALAAQIVMSAAAIHSGMATFADLPEGAL